MQRYLGEPNLKEYIVFTKVHKDPKYKKIFKSSYKLKEVLENGDLEYKTYKSQTFIRISSLKKFEDTYNHIRERFVTIKEAMQMLQIDYHLKFYRIAEEEEITTKSHICMDGLLYSRADIKRLLDEKEEIIDKYYTRKDLESLYPEIDTVIYFNDILITIKRSFLRLIFNIPGGLGGLYKKSLAEEKAASYYFKRDLEAIDYHEPTEAFHRRLQLELPSLSINSTYTKQKWLDYCLTKINTSQANVSSIQHLISNLVKCTKYVMELTDSKELYTMSSNQVNLVFFNHQVPKRQQELLYMFVKEFHDLLLAKNVKCYKLGRIIQPKRNIGTKEKTIYPYEQYRKLFNYANNRVLHKIKAIEDAKKKINKVIRPTQYASSWLYVLVHLNNAWRHSDVVNFPRIEFKDTCIKSLTWIEENEISIDDAKNIVYQVMRKDLTVSKTGATANFFCSDDLTISLATAAAICEFITRECAPFSESIIDFGVKHNKFTAYAHKNFFGEFETDFRFESLKMNRSILSYLYALLEQQGKGAAALEIVQRLRAHYNYSSTEIYIVIPRDQLDFLTQQLFARQNFGYIVDLLAEILYSDNLDNLEQRTNDIITIKKKLGSVYNIEATAGFLNAIQAERKMVVDLLLSKGQDETLDFLFKINAGLLPSKQDNVQCILSESGCIKPQQKECHNCSFSVPNFYSLSALTLSIQSTLEQFNVSFHNTNLPAEKTRLVNLLYKKMDLLVDSCKKFGESEVFKFFEGEKEGYFKLLENLGELSEEVEEYLTYK